MDVGLIGCGRVAQLHMRAYKHIPEANVVAVSDIDFERAQTFAQRHSIKKVLKDYPDFFEMKNLDYVDICTPPSTHCKIVCEAAKSGHNILLEKPMARSTSDCDEMVHEVSKHKVKLCVCHNQLFIPQVAQAKTMVDSGEFDLLCFRVSVEESAELIGAPGWVKTPEQGGVLWETGCHSAYLQLHFLKDIDEVFAIGNKIKHQVHDHFAVLLRAPNKALGVMEVNWLAKRPEAVFELISSDGKHIQILDYNYLLEIPENPPKGSLEGFYRDEKMVIRKWTKAVVENLRKRDLFTCLPHYNLISKYVQSIRDDSDPPVKPEDGRKTIKLLECIEKSLNENQIIQMETR